MYACAFLRPLRLNPYLSLFSVEGLEREDHENEPDLLLVDGRCHMLELTGNETSVSPRMTGTVSQYGGDIAHTFIQSARAQEWRIEMVQPPTQVWSIRNYQTSTPFHSRGLVQCC